MMNEYEKKELEEIEYTEEIEESALKKVFKFIKIVLLFPIIVVLIILAISIIFIELDERRINNAINEEIALFRENYPDHFSAIVVRKLDNSVNLFQSRAVPNNHFIIKDACGEVVDTLVTNEYGFAITIQEPDIYRVVEVVDYDTEEIYIFEAKEPRNNQ
jgi:hypothetical protein